MSDVPAPRAEGEGLRERNRGLLRLLLMIMATLVVASLLVGVRW
jgi:hypothetical protein